MTVLGRNAKLFIDTSSEAVGRVPTTLKFDSVVDTSRTVTLNGGPCHGRVLTTHGTSRIFIPCLDADSVTFNKLGDMNTGPTAFVPYATHEYDAHTGAYLGRSSQVGSRPADKGSQPNEGERMSPAMKAGGKARLLFEDGTGMDGYVDRVDMQMDTFDVTSFGDASKSYIPGLPRYSFAFEGVSFIEAEPAYYPPTKALTNTKEKPNMQLFEYAVMYVPRDDDGNVISKETRVLTEITSMLARNVSSVEKKAIQAITDSDLDLDFVQVIVRPFRGTDGGRF